MDKISHVTSGTRPSRFSRATLKKLGGPGDKAINYATYIVVVKTCLSGFDSQLQ